VMSAARNCTATPRAAASRRARSTATSLRSMPMTSGGARPAGMRGDRAGRPDRW
jgi:hypothetical protein